MTDVDGLLTEYIERFRMSGDADPLPYLDRAGDGRLELAALIDAYLARAPRRTVDTAARNAADDETVDELQRAVGGVSGLWPALLPRLRARAGLKRSELVARLADALGVTDHTDRVASYYHRMEQGRLPSAGVADRVLAALGELLGETADGLRAAGRPLAPPPPPALQTAYARTARTRSDAPAAPAAAAPDPADDDHADAPRWDRVDRMFLLAED